MGQTTWHQRWLRGRKYKPSISKKGKWFQRPKEWAGGGAASGLTENTFDCMLKEKLSASLTPHTKQIELRWSPHIFSHRTSSLCAIYLSPWMYLSCLVYSWFKCISSVTQRDQRFLQGRDDVFPNCCHIAGTFVSGKLKRKTEAILGILTRECIGKAGAAKKRREGCWRSKKEEVIPRSETANIPGLEPVNLL